MSVLVLLLAISPISFTRDNIVFSCALDKTDRQTKDLFKLYQDAFSVLDRDFSWVFASARRVTASVVSGKVDGECLRAHNYIELSGSPNLVRVDAAVAIVDIQVWSQSQNSSIALGEALSNIGPRVGYRRGIVGLEVYLAQQQGIKVTAVSTDELGLKMLVANRLDLYIGVGMQIENSRARIKLKRPIYLAGTLVTDKSYPYLHRRHQNLAAPLAAELKRLIEARGGLIK